MRPHQKLDMTLIDKAVQKFKLGTSDPWSMRQLSHGPRDPACYIEDYRIKDVSFDPHDFIAHHCKAACCLALVQSVLSLNW